jgi:hypothetical protein
MSSQDEQNDTPMRKGGNEAAAAAATGGAGPASSTSDGGTVMTPTTLPPKAEGREDMLFGILRTRDVQLYLKAAAGLAMAYFVVAPRRFLMTVWNIAVTTLGVALGVGLGAGLAIHVFHQLQAWQKEAEDPLTTTTTTRRTGEERLWNRYDPKADPPSFGGAISSSRPWTV